jgi:hypothetical protein
LTADWQDTLRIFTETGAYAADEQSRQTNETGPRGGDGLTAGKRRLLASLKELSDAELSDTADALTLLALERRIHRALAVLAGRCDTAKVALDRFRDVHAVPAAA